MTRFIKSTSIYVGDRLDCPEKRLFVAVLSQAIHDVFSKHVEKRDREQAIHFLTKDSFNLRTVCEIAGRNHVYVIEKINKRLNHGE